MNTRAVIWFNKQSYAFKRGDDGEVWYSLDGAGFTNKVPGGTIGSAPFATIDKDGRLVVGGKGSDDDKTWCSALVAGAKWSDWFTV